jgi:hypothetical protein
VRKGHPDTIDPRIVAWANPVSLSQVTIEDLPPNRLGAGERSVIDDAINQGFRLSPDLYRGALELAGEGS